ncbi:unnamed protein product, partial [Lymnaea stagnalis]
YDNILLVFCSEAVNSVEETAVHCLDLTTKIWTRLAHLDGPAKHLISFQDGENNYIIQRNGNVWRFVDAQDKLVSFHFIGKLWTADRILYGAVLFKNQLTLLGDNPKDYPNDAIFVLNDFPYSIKLRGLSGTCSNFLPVILVKRGLTPVKE